MGIIALNDTEFKSTLQEPIRRLLPEDTRPYSALVIIDYLAECLSSLNLPTTLEAIEIHHNYFSGDNIHEHILFFWGEPNVYLVLVINHQTKSVIGYHLLNLNDVYSPSEQSSN